MSCGRLRHHERRDACSSVAPLKALLVFPLAVMACAKPFAPGDDVDEKEKVYPSEIHASPKLTSIESSEVDGLGRPVRVACVTCHSVRDAGVGFPASESALKAFHTGLTVKHGTLACVACHVDRVGGTPRLHLSDGSELATADTMRLCAQCHGPKYQDYLHGSHGGMNGYWDLSRGPRLRNHCVDCHDPHVPKFQPSRPVLPPKDRLMRPSEDSKSHG